MKKAWRTFMEGRMGKFLSANRGFSAGLFSLLLFVLFRLIPALPEYFYARFVYVGFRYVWDYSIGLLPFPVMLFLPFALVFGWIYLRRKKTGASSFSFRGLLRGLMNLGGILTAVFFLFWGFHYARNTLTEQLEIPIPDPDEKRLTMEVLSAEIEILSMQELMQNRAEYESLSQMYMPDSLNLLLQTEGPRLVKEAIHELNMPAYGKPRAWMVKPEGLLYHLSCSGIYIPFAGEAYVESAMHPTEIPFTYLHELSHAYGYADEADANFIAWVACRKSRYVFFQISATLEYYEYLLKDLRRLVPDEKKILENNIDPGLLELIRARKEYRSRYPAWFPGFQGAFYDLYLKLMGVQGGVKRYSQMTGMVMGWRYKMQHSAFPHF